MRFTGAVACLLVALNCAEKAAGLEPQDLFAADAVWVWWIFAALWGAGCFRFVMGDY